MEIYHNLLVQKVSHAKHFIIKFSNRDTFARELDEIEEKLGEFKKAVVIVYGDVDPADRYMFMMLYPKVVFVYIENALL